MIPNNIVSPGSFPSGWTLWMTKAPHGMLPALALFSYATTYQWVHSTLEYNRQEPNTHYLSGLTQECAKKEEGREGTFQRLYAILSFLSGFYDLEKIIFLFFALWIIWSILWQYQLLQKGSMLKQWKRKWLLQMFSNMYNRQ